jgi:hypothetical protein
LFQVPEALSGVDGFLFQNPLHRPEESGKVVFDGVPYDVGFYPEILVAEHVAHADELTPGNVRIAGKQCFGEVLRSFGNDEDTVHAR